MNFYSFLSFILSFQTNYSLLLQGFKGSEGGKNPPKRWFERKGGKKEGNKNPINYTLFGYVLIFYFSSRPLGCLPLLSVENFTSLSLFRENFVQMNIE